MNTVMIAERAELVSATLCFFHDKQGFETEEQLTSVMYCRIHLPIVPDVFRRFFFIFSHCDVDKRLFSESGEG